VVQREVQEVVAVLVLVVHQEHRVVAEQVVHREQVVVAVHQEHQVVAEQVVEQAVLVLLEVVVHLEQVVVLEHQHLLYHQHQHHHQLILIHLVIGMIQPIRYQWFHITV
jgi:hypothetical protein